MANPLLQKTRTRKMIYFGAIVVLFTLSLIHREFVIKPQAYRLQLREDALGEVELTSSAIRLVLTGSSGLAVTMLWYNAMDKQKRNEWHELELIVKSITKLQPYFITPWLYQSWNLSFNVTVESDRPRDKYYYISRGLELLAEGERRNRGTDNAGVGAAKRVVFPGNPEMRHFMGFFYQLKIGSSDERLTMRTLLELSCIDPVERDAARFWLPMAKGRKEVDGAVFADFCQKYPRTVRRLREQLPYADPKSVVQFLQDHKDIPNRFEPIGKANLERVDNKSNIKKDPMRQFPILPPKEENHWPDPDWKAPALTSETVDVFLISRTWYEFAQKPLPPPDENPRPAIPDYDKSRYRIPKQMVTQLFRAYPARAQVYIAETLESEGWFDSEGWDISASIAKLHGRQGGEAKTVGTESKYFSRLAWDKGFEMYKEFGVQNGMYISPDDTNKLNQLAALCREELKLKQEQAPQAPPADWREGKKGESLDAHMKLYSSRYFRQLTNYAAFYDQAEGERDKVTAAARKLLFAAERKRKDAPSALMLSYYDQAWTLYIHACLKYPRFAQVSSMQEDLCEIHQLYLEASQKIHRETFKKRAVLAAKIGFSPYAMEAGSLSFHTAETLAPVLAFWPPADWRSAVAAQAFAGNYLLDDAGTLVARLAHQPGADWREAIVRYHIVSTTEKETLQMLRVVPIRTRLGPLDTIEYYDGPMALELKDFLFRWTLGAEECGNMRSAVAAIPYPGHEYFLLSRSIPLRHEVPPTDWRPIINQESRRVTMERLGLNR